MLFSANLDCLFSELPFLQRFEAAAQAGFKRVECMFPYEHSEREIAGLLDAHGLEMVAFCLPVGDWERGDRGLAADPERRGEFGQSLETGLAMARELKSPKLICLVGNTREGLDRERILETLRFNVSYAADACHKNDVELMLEPVNHVEAPDFYLNRTDQVMELIMRVDRRDVYLLYDIYHAEKEGEDHDWIMNRHLDRIAHVQIADVPDRCQPGKGQLDVRSVLHKLEQNGYRGTVGLEYFSEVSGPESFDWIEEFGFSRG